MQSSGNIIIEARAVSFTYPGAAVEAPPALSGINLAVKKGDYIALIGPNGSGKTTLLKLFNALLQPTGGEIIVKGISTADEEKLPLVRRYCGMIFQNPDNQLVGTTVEEDIAFGPENLALEPSIIRERVARVSEKMGLAHLAKHPPHQLSGGEKQRVAIAGVLAMKPLCLLMDEPTAMLDPAGRNEVLSTVENLNREEDIAVIHVTHYPEEAALARKVVLLDDGRIAAEGDPRDVLTDLKLLHRLGLQGTAAVELAAMLKNDGFEFPPRLLHSRELVHEICSSAQKI